MIKYSFSSSNRIDYTERMAASSAGTHQRGLATPSWWVVTPTGAGLPDSVSWFPFQATSCSVRLKVGVIKGVATPDRETFLGGQSNSCKTPKKNVRKKKEKNLQNPSHRRETDGCKATVSNKKKQIFFSFSFLFVSKTPVTASRSMKNCVDNEAQVIRQPSARKL